MESDVKSSVFPDVSSISLNGAVDSMHASWELCGAESPDSLPSATFPRLDEAGSEARNHSGFGNSPDDLFVCPSPSVLEEHDVEVAGLSEHPDDSGTFSPVDGFQWELGVAALHGQFSQMPSALLLPWETGAMSEVFKTDDFLQLPAAHLPEPETALMEKAISAADTVLVADDPPADSCFDKAVQNLKDLEYFQNKNRQLELACGQWLELLSCDWAASGVGTILARDLQADPSGDRAYETLKAAFGTKSPQTLLKRCSSMKKYFKWHVEHIARRGPVYESPFPLVESHVWEFFLCLREERKSHGRGFTNTAAFLETIRFAKFTLELKDTEPVLASRRLLGFAAIEKQLKGPTKQAPPLELVHLQRLHSVLESGSCNYDRLGAAAMLICVYGRARWSDLRYIHHVNLEEGRSGFLTLYTREHKTSATGAKREQYLPLVVPWMGITHHDWVNSFLELYLEMGLDIHQVPLGPLMPAPKLGGGFASRPLSTAEAAKWLRLLLSGTPECESFRAHSLKSTLLVWSAKAGLEKEVRAVLGHHASALEGSEVVYSRYLQTRALRKLCMLLHRVRLGLGLEVDPMVPNPFATPVPRSPVFQGNVPKTPALMERPVQDGAGLVDTALEEANLIADNASVKDEALEDEQIASAADSISLFPLNLVTEGIVEVDSSSGSESSSNSSTSSSSSSDSPVVAQPEREAYSEKVPDDCTFFKNKKSSIVHKVKRGCKASACGLSLSSNLQEMPRVLTVRWPKCIKCFPKDSNRLRNVEQMAEAIDIACKRSKRQ